MKAKLVWIKKFEWVDGEKVPMINETWWEIVFTEPTYNEELYEAYVLIPVEENQ